MLGTEGGAAGVVWAGCSCAWGTVERVSGEDVKAICVGCCSAAGVMKGAEGELEACAEGGGDDMRAKHLGGAMGDAKRRRVTESKSSDLILSLWIRAALGVGEEGDD